MTGILGADVCSGVNSALVLVGLLLGGFVALLARTLAAERRQTNALRLEKARSEQLLQAALTESSRLSAVLEATPDIVGMASLDGRGLYLNRAGRQRLGLQPGESAENYNISTFYTEQSFQTIVDEGIPVAMKNGSWSSELVMRSLDGEEIPVSMAGLVHFDAGGAPTYMSAIARDISESRRTAAELQTAKEAAEAASRSKGTFLATMSHEIRTPMNAVIGMTDLLLSTELTPRQREFVETIRAGGDALLTVINDILDFSKIEAGRLELERRTFDLRTTLESTMDLLAPRAAEKGLELALNVDPAVPTTLIGDEMRIRQILVNLIGNGIKFTDHGEVVVAVTANAAAPDALHVELLVTVRDTGIGIPAAKRDRLFSSFAQVDPSTTREYGGTGLGLAISKRLVELMGGTIWMESEGIPGRGSVFQFTMPIDRASMEHRPVPRGSQPALAGRRVLVVEDNATNRHILCLQLQSWGLLAVQAALPVDALDLLQRRQRLDLIILDMQMPGMDGLSLARAICDRCDGTRLPIIMLTSVDREVGAEAEAIAGFAGRLTKPVKVSQLYDAILAALADRATRAQDSQGSALTVVAGDPRSPPAPLEILLAEDMEVNRRLALLALEELGYHAAVAVNGAEVLRALNAASYDVILMDVHMPQIDGIEATRRIRREQRGVRQPYIIAMTANAMRGDREMCLEAGMDDYLSKPIYRDELRASLERASDRIALSRKSGAPVETTFDEAVHHETALDDRGEAPVLDRRAQSSGPALIDVFVREADDTYQRLSKAFASGDLNGVREAAHALKGISAYVGGVRVARASAAIDRAARTGEALDWSTVEKLHEELAVLRRDLLSIVTETRPAAGNDAIGVPAGLSCRRVEVERMV